jgi:membrane-associated protein
MEIIRKLIYTLNPFTQVKLHDKLNGFIQYVGPATFYIVIFLIIFCETGLVVTPFLPGDSLLFAVGAIGGHPDAAFSVPVVGVLVMCAALLGDNTNYWFGRRVGPKVFKRDDSRLLNKKHLARAQEFYDKYGAKTIILARFVPIIRTFAPFVAGIGRMNYVRFLLFSVLGALAWVSLCLSAGWALGSREFVRNHFEVVVVVIVIISVLPMLVEFIRARQAAKRGGSALVEATTIGKSEG